MSYDVRALRGEQVDFAGVYRVPRTGAVIVSPSALRFIDPEDLRALVVASDLEVTGWFGDWDRSDVADDSPEVVVLARRV